jgi:hypothetical protein
LFLAVLNALCQYSVISPDHHQGIICVVAFPPEAGKRSLLDFTA